MSSSNSEEDSSLVEFSKNSEEDYSVHDISKISEYVLLITIIRCEEKSFSILTTIYEKDQRVG